MSNSFDQCPQCQSPNIYQDMNTWVCPECGHEWTSAESSIQTSHQSENEFLIKDANGNILQEGDTVTVIKDLKIKGASGTVKGGTKIKGIRFIDGHDGHNLNCKIEGLGMIQLKSEYVKKS